MKDHDVTSPVRTVPAMLLDAARWYVNDATGKTPQYYYLSQEGIPTIVSAGELSAIDLRLPGVLDHRITHSSQNIAGLDLVNTWHYWNNTLLQLPVAAFVQAQQMNVTTYISPESMHLQVRRDGQTGALVPELIFYQCLVFETASSVPFAQDSLWGRGCLDTNWLDSHYPRWTEAIGLDAVLGLNSLELARQVFFAQASLPSGGLPLPDLSF